MAEQPILLARAHYRELKDATYDLAILPWGATEPHNYHLPYGTDIIESERIAEESARVAAGRGARCIVLPSIPFGVNTTQLDIPLTINMNPSTQMAVLEDVTSSLEGHGIPKLAILNSHGGNDFKQMIRELQTRHRIFLCSVNWWITLDLKEYFRTPGDHAGEMETSVMMHFTPDLVLPLSVAGPGRERKPKIRGFQERWAWAPRPWTKVTTDTGAGDPSEATSEKGRRYIAAVTEKIGVFFAELAAADLNDLYEEES
jgi:creatinine amidohydrolase